MADSCLFMGWKKPFEGRQRAAIELFGVFMGYLGEQVQNGTLESVEPVFLEQHGGDLNGYIIMRGEGTKIDVLKRTPRFVELATQASVCLDGYGLVEGVLGRGIEQRMALFAKYI